MKLEKTITSIFMVPTLKIPKDQMSKNNFINGYIKDLNRDVQYENAVYLLFKPENIDVFREFVDSEYERTQELIDDYNYDDKHIVLVYQLDNNFKNDFDLIKQGKYSKTSKEFQKLFPEKLIISIKGYKKEEISLQYRIFNKTEDLLKYWEEILDITFKKEFRQGLFSYHMLPIFPPAHAILSPSPESIPDIQIRVPYQRYIPL